MQISVKVAAQKYSKARAPPPPPQRVTLSAGRRGRHHLQLASAAGCRPRAPVTTQCSCGAPAPPPPSALSGRRRRRRHCHCHCPRPACPKWARRAFLSVGRGMFVRQAGRPLCSPGTPGALAAHSQPQWPRRPVEGHIAALGRAFIVRLHYNSGSRLVLSSRRSSSGNSRHVRFGYCRWPASLPLLLPLLLPRSLPAPWWWRLQDHAPQCDFRGRQAACVLCGLCLPAPRLCCRRLCLLLPKHLPDIGIDATASTMLLMMMLLPARAASLRSRLHKWAPGRRPPPANGSRQQPLYTTMAPCTPDFASILLHVRARIVARALERPPAAWPRPPSRTSSKPPSHGTLTDARHRARCSRGRAEASQPASRP